MKNIITAILLFVFTNLVAQNYVNTSDIYLNNNISLNNHITTVILKNTLGNPVSTQTTYSEIDNANMLNFIYSNAKYNFINDDLVSFELNKNATLKINNITITVGETSESIINNNFQIFKKNNSFEYYQIPLATNNNLIDYFISIEIDSSKKVSKIIFWYP
ncbi:MAG: hypothetical protein ACRC8Z_15580 [Empedobacter falsenii]